jgi:hypothetical protein
MLNFEGKRHSDETVVYDSCGAGMKQVFLFAAARFNSGDHLATKIYQIKILLPVELQRDIPSMETKVLRG